MKWTQNLSRVRNKVEFLDVILNALEFSVHLLIRQSQVGAWDRIKFLLWDGENVFHCQCCFHDAKITSNLHENFNKKKRWRRNIPLLSKSLNYFWEIFYEGVWQKMNKWINKNFNSNIFWRQKKKVNEEETRKYF